MVKTVTSHLLSILIPLIIFILTFSLLSYHHGLGEEPQYTSQSNTKKSVENINQIDDLESLEKEIHNREREIESLRSRLENIREDLIEVGSRQKRSLRSDLPKCPARSPHLRGTLIINEELSTLEAAEERLEGREIGPGGRHQPGTCHQTQRTALVIPYRDRPDHLAVWLSHLHPLLARQQRDYQVFLVEQVDTFPFNRGALLNIGVLEARKLGEFNCFVLHDVDMIPETDLALYQCPPSGQILHMAVSVSRWRYRIAYNQYSGGIVLANNQTINKLNGFSNSFYGWGGEDDDFYCRLVRNNVTINRYPGSVARMRMLTHKAVEENPQLKEMDRLSKDRQLDHDGLRNAEYTVIDIKTEKLFTRIRVKLPPPPAPRKKSLLEVLTNTVVETENKIVSSVVEKWSQFTEGMAKEEETHKVKIYY